MLAEDEAHADGIKLETQPVHDLSSSGVRLFGMLVAASPRSACAFSSSRLSQNAFRIGFRANLCCAASSSGTSGISGRVVENASYPVRNFFLILSWSLLENLSTLVVTLYWLN